MRMSETKKFLGQEIISLFFKVIFFGFFIFLIESSSVYVIQGVLLALGLMSSHNSMFIPSWYPTDVASNVSILLIFGLFRFIFTTGLTYYTGIVPEVFKITQRKRIVEFSLSLNNDNSFAGFYSLFTESAERAGNALMTIFSGVVNLLLGTLLLVYSFSIAWKEVSVALFLLAFLFIPLKILSKGIRRSGDSIIASWHEINSEFGNSVKNRFLINIYNLSEKVKQNFNSSMGSYNRSFFSYRLATAFQTNLTNFIGLLIFSIVCFLGRSYFETDASVLIAVFYLLIRSIQYLNAPINSYSTYQFSKGFFNELFDVFMCETSPKETDIAKPSKFLDVDNITIRATNLTFQYPHTDAAVFEDLNFSVTKGEVLLIMGQSGSGKSTLLKLVLGLCSGYGELTINGVAPVNVDRKLFDHIAYVGPDPYLFQGSVYDNLTFGHPNPGKINENDVNKVLSKVGLLSDIEKRGGLSVTINEFDGFSTGQKQRFSIARALLRSPSLLILDECTANLDESIEKAIVEIIKNASNDMTTIAISHRPIFKSLATQLIILGVK